MSALIQKIKYISIGLAAGIILSGGVVFAASDYVLSLFEAKIIVNGQEKQGSDKPFQYFNGNTYVPTSLNLNGTTYVPIRFFAESAGMPVDYKSETQTIFIGQQPEINEAQYMSDILIPYYKTGDFYSVNKPMKIAGRQYYKGYRLSGFSDGSMSFNLEGKYTNISGTVGLEDDYNKSDTALQIYGDDELIREFQLEHGGMPQSLDINVKGVGKLDIKVLSKSAFNSSIINLADILIK